MNNSRRNAHSPVSSISSDRNPDFLDRIPALRSPITKSASAFNMCQPNTFWSTEYEKNDAPEVNQNPYVSYLGQPPDSRDERYQLHDINPQSTGNRASIQPDSHGSEPPRYVANTAEVNYFRPGKNYRNHFRLAMIAAIIFLLIVVVLGVMLGFKATKLRRLQSSTSQNVTITISAISSSTLFSTLSTTGTVTATATTSIPTTAPTTIIAISTLLPVPISVTQVITEKVTIIETLTTFPPFLVSATCSTGKTTWTFVVECEHGKGPCKTVVDKNKKVARTRGIAYPTRGLVGVSA